MQSSNRGVHKWLEMHHTASVCISAEQRGPHRAPLVVGGLGKREGRVGRESGKGERWAGSDPVRSPW
jgi:hypothetical protein